MTPDEFSRYLRQSLADRRLSGSEREALLARLNEAVLDGHRRAVLRHGIFALARDELLTEDAKQILDWVEEAVKLLAEPAAASRSWQAEAYFSPADDCVGRIVRLFREARESIDICVFTITDDSLSEAIVSAHGRGVAIRIITDDQKALDPGSDIERFVEAGLRVRVDRSAFHMHHKFAIFDSRHLLNGSFNWTRGAARDNEENIIITDQPELLRRFATKFEQFWKDLG